MPSTPPVQATARRGNQFLTGPPWRLDIEDRRVCRRGWDGQVHPSRNPNESLARRGEEGSSRTPRVPPAQSLEVARGRTRLRSGQPTDAAARILKRGPTRRGREARPP